MARPATILGALLLAAVASCSAAAEPDAPRLTVSVDPADRLYEVDPRFFGVCPMFWLENDAEMADGLIENHLRELPARFLRFPGGTESDGYLWDERRLHDPNRWPYRDGPDTMDTDKFIALCRRLDAEPILCVNTELAHFESPQHAIDLAARWVHYCNREENYQVRYWEIGNEPYFHTRFDAREYAELFVKMARAMKAVDPTIQVAAVGRWKLSYPGVKATIPASSLAQARQLEYRLEQGDRKLEDQLHALRTLTDAPPWWPIVLDVAGPEIDLVSIHWYFNTDQDLPRITEQIQQFRDLCRQKVPDRQIDVILTEWTLHHLDPALGMPRALAVGEAVGKLLDGGVRMATYWPLRCGGNQNRKALLDFTDRSPTANYRVLQLFARNTGRFRIASHAAADSLYHFATIDDAGRIALFLVNRTDRPCPATIALTHAAPPSARVQLLHAGDDPDSRQIHETNFTLAPTAGHFSLTLPPWSIALLSADLPTAAEPALSPDLLFPCSTAPAAQQRPWTRWWWLGNAVDEPNLTTQLTAFANAGLGGVEICPIYGPKGYEDRFVDFLSPRWLELLAHTTRTAAGLDLAVDLTTGTGWPFGGPHVTTELSSTALILETFPVPSASSPRSFDHRLPRGTIQYALALAPDGRRLDLTHLADGPRIAWQAPPGDWTIYLLAARNRLQQVKRAAPAGQGLVLDPYSQAALEKYLAPFSATFAHFDAPLPRAQFHDSFEYFAADWTADFLDRFQALRGYDLRDHLPALFPDADPDTAARVKHDYRQTIHDLHLAWLQRWTQWAHDHGFATRNQAHGAPGNLLDLYAAADIPETEIFRKPDASLLPQLKFASSAAHLTGRPLASAEAFTWLGEHFQTRLADLKIAADLLFISGVNHLVFHGIPYSPADAPWPGWQFYAAVNLGPTGGLWQDLPAFNAYLTRCQSILQTGRPDPDLLLYYPVHDLWQDPDDLLIPCRVHNQDQWLRPTPFYRAARHLLRHGYQADYVSDRLLAHATVQSGRIRLGDTITRAILLPPTKFLPPETLENLLDLARNGATILIADHLPTDVPGLTDLPARRDRLRNLLKQLHFDSNTPRRAPLGNGALLLGDLQTLLPAADIHPEPAREQGLLFLRRTHPKGHHYFFFNPAFVPFQGWLTLARPAHAAVILDPLHPDRTGLAATRRRPDGRDEIYLQLATGQSLFLRTFTDQTPAGPPWPYAAPAGDPLPLQGPWRVEFIAGGPQVPLPQQLTQLSSWTDWPDPATESFAGTARYSLEFDLPDPLANRPCRLDLGRVHDSARVALDSQPLATLFAPPFTLDLPPLSPGRHRLDLEITNLPANRIRDLDRRNVPWKYFHDANVLNIDYQPLNAANWPLQPAGLLGPVTLTPLTPLAPK